MGSFFNGVEYIQVNGSARDFYKSRDSLNYIEIYSSSWYKSDKYENCYYVGYQENGYRLTTYIEHYVWWY